MAWGEQELGLIFTEVWRHAFRLLQEKLSRFIERMEPPRISGIQEDFILGASDSNSVYRAALDVFDSWTSGCPQHTSEINTFHRWFTVQR
jgi:hypothetical protein